MPEKAERRETASTSQMSEQDAAPAAETDIAESATPLSKVLGGDRHERAEEVGHVEEAPTPEPVAAEPSPTPAPAAMPAPTGDFDAFAADPKFQEWLKPRLPKFAREHIKTANQTVAEARAEAERARSYAPQPQQQRPAAPSAATQLPNPIDDPQGYHDAVVARAREGAREEARQERLQGELAQNLRSSERWARREAGNETFEDCKAWLSTKPNLETMFIREPDPWGAALAYYQRERLTEEIGDDPAAYRKRIEEEAIARYQEQQGQAPATPAPQMRSPPPAPASLARSAAPRDNTGRFTGPSPLGNTFKHKAG